MRWIRSIIGKVRASAKSASEFQGYGAGFRERANIVNGEIKRGINGIHASDAMAHTSRVTQEYGDVSDLLDEGVRWKDFAREKAASIAAEAEYARTQNDAIRMGVAAGVLENAADGRGTVSRSVVAKLLKTGRAASKTGEREV